MGFAVQHYISRQNYELLKKNHPAVLEQLKRTATGPVGEIVVSPGAKPNLKIEHGGEWLFIHPEDNPEDDGNFFLAKIPENFSGVEIIFGMGLGYGVKEVLLQRNFIRNVIIIENDPGIFLQALKYTDLSDLLSDSKVIIGLCPETAESFMQPVNKAIAFEETQLLDHKTITALARAAYDNLRTMVYDYVNTYNVSGATMLQYGKTIVLNRFEHLKTMGHNYLFETLLDKFQSIPAYIVAAGPSLDKNIHLLRKVQGRAVIICVDTALPSMLKNGIPPDFVTSIDYKENTYEKIAHVIKEIPDRTGLFVYSWTGPKVVKNFPGSRKFFLLTESGMDQWFSKLVNGSKFFAGSSSVANLNFITAKLLGCSSIIFVGQDLAYGSGHSHSKDAILSVQDKVKESLVTGQDIVWVKGVEGGQVPTTRGMKIALDVFESLIQGTPGDYINCSTGGAHIEGTRYMHLEEAVGKYYSETFNVTEVINELCVPEKCIDPNHIIKKLKMTLKEVQTVIFLTEKVEKLLKKAKTQLPIVWKTWRKKSVLPEKNRKVLDEIDTINVEIDNHNDIWAMLEDATSSGLKDNEQMEFEIQRFKGVHDKYPVWLAKTIDRLRYVNDVRKEMLGMLENGITASWQNLEKEQGFLTGDSKGDLQTACDLSELYVASGDYVLAKPYVKQYIEHEPNSAQANYFMGCLKAHQNDFEKMDAFFSMAINLDPSYVNTIKKFRYNLANGFLDSAERAEEYDTRVSQKLLVKGLKYCPFHKKMQKGLAQLLDRDLNKIKNAFSNRTLEEQESRIEGWIRTLNDFSQAYAFLSNSSISLVYFYKGVLSFKSDEKEKSKGLFNKSIAYAPRDANRILEIADLFLCSFDYDSGLVYLNKAIDLDLKYAAYWESFGDFLYRAKKFDESITAYTRTLEYYPNNDSLRDKIVESLLQKGNRFHHKGEFKQAEAVYDEAINLSSGKHPSLIHLYNNKGSALKNLGKYEAAMICYDKALDMNPDYVESLYNKGELLEHFGKVDSALLYYGNIIKKYPQFDKAYHRMSNLLFSMGEKEKAMSVLEKARQLSKS